MKKTDYGFLVGDVVEYLVGHDGGDGPPDLVVALQPAL